MNNNEILAKIENIEKGLQELKSMLEVSSESVRFLPTKAQTTPEKPPEEIIDITSTSYDPEEFDIEYGVLYKYLGEREEVTIPYGVEIIEDEAFYGNHKIKKINLPDTVTEIEKFAFCQCENLVEINNAKNVIKIDELAFYECKSLEKIDIRNVIKINYRAFCGCSSLKRLRFSNNIEIIDSKAFYGCSNLKISFPATCKYGDDAFKGCKNVNYRR